MKAIDRNHHCSPYYNGIHTSFCKMCNKEYNIENLNQFGDCWDCEQKYIFVGLKFYYKKSNCKIVKIRYHYIFDEKTDTKSPFVELERTYVNQLDFVTIVAYDKKNNKQIIIDGDFFEKEIEI